MGILEPLYPKAEPECLSPSTGQAVTVNGVSEMPPKVYTGSGLSLRRAGLFLLLTTCLGLTLLWDGGQPPPPAISPTPRSSPQTLPPSHVWSESPNYVFIIIFFFIMKAIPPHQRNSLKIPSFREKK